MRYYIGVDIGTSSAKLTAITQEGKTVARCSRDYQYEEPGAGWKEIRPDIWAEAAESGLSELLEKLDDIERRKAASGECENKLTGSRYAGRRKVEAVGFTGQMHTTVFLDRNGESIRPAIMWNDVRTKDQINCMKRYLSGAPDTRFILKILSTGSPAANLFWMKRQEPENFERLATFLIGPDYLVYYFSGVAGTDYCEASTSSLYDPEARKWSETMRHLIGLPEEVYPMIRGSEETAGVIRPELAERFGLSPDVRIVVGTGDNPAAAVASGAIRDHYPVLSIGTSGVLVFSRDHLRDDVKGKQILYSPDGNYVDVLVQGVVQSAGGTYQWMAKKILEAQDFDALTAGVDANLLGEDGLLFYPHLNGDKTIYGDPSLRGAFFGLETRHSRADLAVAVMEGICFAFRQLIEEMALTEDEVGKMMVTGGGSASSLWMQILANILGVTVRQMDGDEGAAYGAARMAAGSRITENAAVKIRGRFIPEPSRVDLYNKKYQKYLKIYGALKLLED